MTTQVIFEDQQTDFEILIHNYMNLQTDELPGTASSGELTSDTSETERAGPEPHSKKFHQGKTAKALDLLLGKTF